MSQNHISEMLRSTLEKVRELVDADTIIGTPITFSEDVTVVPVSQVSIGLAGGGSDFAGGSSVIGGSGTGVAGGKGKSPSDKTSVSDRENSACPSKARLAIVSICSRKEKRDTHSMDVRKSTVTDSIQDRAQTKVIRCVKILRRVGVLFFGRAGENSLGGS